tara:strand:+ start:16 stop:771 length:756 start_codon:yes stop_codon:yes gene_type:complete
MKYAILINGEYRQFKEAVRTWKFKDELDCDFYVSTWNRSFQYNSKLGIDLNEIITEEDIVKYLPNSNINIVDQYNLDYEDETGNIPKVYDNSIAMKYHWQQCLKQLENSNKHYDNVVIMRPDLWLEHDNWESFFNNNNDDRIYSNAEITESDGHPFIMDLFLMGNLSNIKKIINYFEPKNLQLNHQTLAESILSNNLFVETLDFGIQIMRPNLRRFGPPTPELVEKCNKLWQESHSEDDMEYVKNHYKNVI